MDGNGGTVENRRSDRGPVRPEIAQIVTQLYAIEAAVRRKEEYDAQLARLREVSKKLAIAQDLDDFEAAVESEDELVDIDWLRSKLANRLAEVETPKTSIETAAWLAAFDCRPYSHSLSCDPPTQEEKDVLYLERLVNLKDLRKDKRL